jgi:hypothetical protein
VLRTWSGYPLRMTDEEQSRGQQVAAVVALTLLSTALVWWEEEDLVLSPVTLVLLPLVVVVCVALAKLGRSPADRAAARESRRRPRQSRTWAEVPSSQRQRVWVVLGCSVLLVVLQAPLLVLGLVEGKVDGAMLLLVAVCVAALALSWWVWWVVRHPTELTTTRERRRTWSVGRSLATYGIFLVALSVARGVYRALDPEALRLLAAGAVGFVAAVVMVLVSARLARRPIPEKQVW